MIYWTRENGQVWTFDNWEQLVEECKKLPEFEEREE